jgi:PKD repeat protein
MKSKLLRISVIFSLMAFMWPVEDVQAQKNIAPDATLSTNAFSNATFPPTGTNNRVINACGTQETWFNWGPGRFDPYLEWNWGKVVTVNKMVLYHGNAPGTGRYMNGFDIERWTGTAWVRVASVSGLTTCESTVNFTPTSTSRLRITQWTLGAGGQQSNPNFREIEIYELPAPNNAGISALLKPSFGCETPSDISVRLANLGIERLDSAMVYWSINGSTPKSLDWNSGSNYRIGDTLGTGGFVDLTLETNVTFNDYTNYEFKIWSAMPNGQADTVNADDTLTTEIYFLGNPGNAVANDVERCGVGTVALTATATNQNDDIFWYDQEIGGSVVARGQNAISPFLYETDSFFAQAVRVSQENYLTNGLSPGVATIVSNGDDEEGGFIQIEVGPAAVTLDTLQFVVQNNNNVPYALYVKEGGISTRAADWTLVNEGMGNVAPVAGRQPYVLTVDAKDYILEENKTYTLYFTIIPNGSLSNNVYLNTGTRDEADDFISISGGTVCNGLFASIGQYRTWSIDIGIEYSYACPSPGRVGMEAEVKELLQEAEVIQGSNFDGYFRRGTTNEPDLTTEGRSITYELKPPVNNPNTSFGTSWLISSIDLRSVNGTPIPTGDLTTTNPTSTANGTMTYSPSAGWEDSTIMATVGVRNLANGCDTFITRYIYIAPIPTASFEVTRVCLGDVTEFTNNSSVLKGFMTYEWDFGDGNTSDFTDPVHLFQNAGTFQVKLTTTTELGFSDDTTITVDVNHIPNISYKVINACEGTNIRFDNQTTIIGGAPITYRWDFGDGNSSTMEDPEHRYSTPGGYRVTLRATANGCVSTLTKNANQFAKPVADFDFEGQCQGADIQFNNMTTISTTDFVGVKWTFEPGEFETINNPAYAFSTSGSKDVKMVAISQFNCLDSITKTVNVAPGPVADFDFGQVCNIDPTTFTNTTTEPTGLLYVYSWDFGDGTTSDQKSPTHQYTQLGERMVTLTVDASNNCASTISKMVDVKIQPEAGFDVAGACSGELVDFRNQTRSEGGIVNYNWNFGDGTSSTENQPKKVYTPMTSTSYNVELVASIVGGCSDTARTTITINETPICSYTQTSTGDNWGREWTFSPDNKSYGATAYTWLIEGQGVYQEMEPTVTFTEPTTYTVKLC